MTNRLVIINVSSALLSSLTRTLKFRKASLKESARALLSLVSHGRTWWGLSSKRICLSGARGTTLTFSSGDGGVGDGDPDPATQTCISNDGLNTTKFLPEFPSSCP